MMGFWKKRGVRGLGFAYQSNDTEGVESGGRDGSDGNDGEVLEARSKTWETTVTRIPSWPEEARPLKKHNWVSYFYLVGDVLLAILPLYFILLGVAVITLNGKPTKDNGFGGKVEAAIQLGPTIFPILFAAISGRSMKMIARYLAERGAKLSTLEILLAAQSVGGTVESQLLMRRLTLVGANLLFLWSMSPLGGQASLRLLEKSSASNQTSMSLRYLSTGPGANVLAMETIYAQSPSQADPLYTTALLAPNKVKAGPEDPWGNVKIPRFNSLNSSSADQDGWITVPRNGLSPEDYISLAGIPVVSRPANQDAKFTLETTQLTLECQPFLQKNMSDLNLTMLQDMAPGWIWQNMSEDNSPFKSSSFFLQIGQADDESRKNTFFGVANISVAGKVFKKRTITYVSSSPFEENFDSKYRVSMTNCTLGQAHTETEITCTRETCFPARIRESLTDDRPKEVTALDHHMIQDAILRSFPNTFQWRGSSTPTEQFISNVSSFPFVFPAVEDLNNRGGVDLALLPADVFAARFALLLNTYYQLSLAPNAYMGSLPSSNLSFYGPDTIPRLDLESYLPSNISLRNMGFDAWYTDTKSNIYHARLGFVGATTNATMTSTQEIYTCNFAWLALLFAAAGILLVTGTVSLILKHKTLGPDMFGFVASLTYENSHVHIPEGGSTLDAMERARMLKDTEVYIGDVRSDDDIGHIALATGVPQRKLDRNRLYC